MFAIQKGESEFVSKGGDFVSLAHYKEIKWFAHYITASQSMMKMSEKDLQVQSSEGLLEIIMSSISGFAPELIQIWMSAPCPEAAEITDLALLRAALAEQKQFNEELKLEIKKLKKESGDLITEAQRLATVSEDYTRLLKSITSKQAI